jgi:hypothetical protein
MENQVEASITSILISLQSLNLRIDYDVFFVANLLVVVCSSIQHFFEFVDHQKQENRQGQGKNCECKDREQSNRHQELTMYR